MKEDVLHDLPPKIIQDYYCELSPLQARLYEDFSKSRAKHGIEDIFEDEEETENKKGKGKSKKGKAKSENTGGASHVFQALQYLRKLCSHPILVLTTQHPEYKSVMDELKRSGNSDLHDITHAPKLVALRDLLLECGIEGNTMNANLSSSQNSFSTSEVLQPMTTQHRVLIFAQMKSMLDLIETDLFEKLMPGVTYLRMDGSTDPSKRHTIVTQFNQDPTIDVLLLTTHVGGLGLNLTGADTVIFLEHDWNPMKDLQAMDRAHRIGQTKVVTVYRLITRGTLEEKIMGLQKFKLNIANTVVNKENSSLSSMSTDQLLDLFQYKESKKDKNQSKGLNNNNDDNQGENTSEGSKKKGKLQQVIDSLSELWDESQYEEYNLENFMNSLQ